MHLDQLFVDGLDAYVWIYDPIPVYYWFFGTLLVLAATAICLFPLWPPSVRYEDQQHYNSYVVSTRPEQAQECVWLLTG